METPREQMSARSPDAAEPAQALLGRQREGLQAHPRSGGNAESPPDTTSLINPKIVPLGHSGATERSRERRFSPEICAGFQTMKSPKKLWRSARPVSIADGVPDRSRTARRAGVPAMSGVQARPRGQFDRGAALRRACCDTGLGHGDGGVAIPGARRGEPAARGAVDPGLQLAPVGAREAASTSNAASALPTHTSE